MSESERHAAFLEYRDDIDRDTFGQILEMDDDEDDREFSSQIVYDFFEQAKQTLEAMEKAVEDKDTRELSSLGHFLKGSSATLGLIKVRDACEKIQNWGALHDEHGDGDISKADALMKIKSILPVVKRDVSSVKTRLYDFYAPRD